MILSSKIPLVFANTNKKDKISLFISEYQSAVKFYVDYLWTKCDILNQNYNIPKYISSEIKPTSDLSARALKCAATQACGITKSRVKKLAKTQYIIKKKQKENKDISKLQSKYDKLLNLLAKPDISKVYPELNSICCKFENKKTPKFDGLITLFSLGKKYGKISIPVKKTKHFNMLNNIGLIKTSFLISHLAINVRFDIKIEQKTIGLVEGADQGIKTCLTLSDTQVTGKDNHGHDLNSIICKLKRKTK